MEGVGVEACRTARSGSFPGLPELNWSPLKLNQHLTSTSSQIR